MDQLMLFEDGQEGAHQQPERTGRELARVCSEIWAEFVSSDDHRFAHLLPKGRGSFAEMGEHALRAGNDGECRELIAAVPKIRARLLEIDDLSLEEALKELVFESSRLRGARLDGMIDRLGWGGEPPKTLESVGRQLGLTRERVRQLQQKLTGKLPGHPIYLPQLSRAVEQVLAAAPCKATDAAALLQDAGISRIPFHPKSLIAAAEGCGVFAPFVVRKIRGVQMVVNEGALTSVHRLEQFALRQASSCGAASIDDVVERCHNDGVEIQRPDAAAVLRGLDHLSFFSNEEWFWYPAGLADRNRLRNVCRRMLSVVNRIRINVIQEGVAREYLFRSSTNAAMRHLRVPPVDVLTEFLQEHPEFEVDEHGFATHTGILDYRKELGEVEIALADVLRGSPSGVLDRGSVRSACLARGINFNSLEIGLTYSPIIDHIELNVWCLRGATVHPAAIDALREANRARPRERRVYGYGWTDQGRVWVAARIPSTEEGNLVLGIPAPVRRYFVGRKFIATSPQVSGNWNIGVSEEGTAYGFNGFLSSVDIRKTEFLVAEFDISKLEAEIRTAMLEDVQNY